jgi:hypothetical protein
VTLTLDTKDDRRELWHLLHRLPPERRVAFLAGWCRVVRARDPRGCGPMPFGMEGMVADARRCDRGDDRLTNAVYVDLVSLANQWGLDLAEVAADLEAAVRRPASRAVSAGCTPSPASARSRGSGCSARPPSPSAR